MRIRTSFWALLSQDVAEDPQLVLERVRRDMLSALSGQGEQEFMALDMSIRLATSMDELWCLRGELAQALVTCVGQARLQKTRVWAVL